jgi:hypothetical protein
MLEITKKPGSARLFLLDGLTVAVRHAGISLFSDTRIA